MPDPTIATAPRANWRASRYTGRKADHRGVPVALTGEFLAGYRLHPRGPTVRTRGAYQGSG
ncbi:hypothetical protein [Streptomyces sp. A5-4]|uniref:hypothetical protein n=1 Tax=Streptomyces sp. A5-4 TaxID=3384771 RepID=UPI003DA9717E